MKQIRPPFQRVKDPTGRLDWLACKLIERAVQRIGKPEVSAMYADVREPLEAFLRECLSPRKKAMRDLRKHIKTGTEMLAAAQNRRVA